MSGSERGHVLTARTAGRKAAAERADHRRAVVTAVEGHGQYTIQIMGRQDQHGEDVVKRGVTPVNPRWEYQVGDPVIVACLGRRFSILSPSPSKSQASSSLGWHTFGADFRRRRCQPYGTPPSSLTTDSTVAWGMSSSPKSSRNTFRFPFLTEDLPIFVATDTGSSTILAGTDGDGGFQWTVSGASSCVSMYEDWMFTGTWRSVKCVALKTGAVVWTNTATGDASTGTTTSIAVNDVYVFVCARHQVRAIDRRTGRTAWTGTDGVSGSFVGRNDALVLHEGRPYVRHFDDDGTRSLARLDDRYRLNPWSDPYPPPALSETAMVAYVRCYDARTGRAAWECNVAPDKDVYDVYSSAWAGTEDGVVFMYRAGPLWGELVTWPATEGVSVDPCWFTAYGYPTRFEWRMACVSWDGALKWQTVLEADRTLTTRWTGTSLAGAWEVIDTDPTECGWYVSGRTYRILAVASTGEVLCCRDAVAAFSTPYHQAELGTDPITGATGYFWAEYSKTCAAAPLEVFLVSTSGRILWRTEMTPTLSDGSYRIDAAGFCGQTATLMRTWVKGDGSHVQEVANVGVAGTWTQWKTLANRAGTTELVLDRGRGYYLDVGGTLRAIE